MITRSFIGNSTVTDFFQKLCTRQKLGHAYLFVGPEHVGKRTFAEHLARTLLAHGNTEHALDHYPDYIMIARTRDAKSGKLHNAIVLDQIHALRGRLALSSFHKSWKICVIDGADMLNVESANALLKNIEEPRGQTLFLLTAPSIDAVLPTIRSRCQTIQFTRVPMQILFEGLRERGIGVSQSTLLARLASGCPGRAIDFAENTDSFDQFLSLRGNVLVFPRQSHAQRFASIEKMFPPKIGFQETVEHCAWILSIVSSVVRDALFVTYGTAHDTALVHGDAKEILRTWAALGRFRLLSIHAAILAAQQFLDHNVQPRAVLEYVAMTV